MRINFQHIIWKFKRSKTCHKLHMIQKEITAYAVCVWAYWLTTTTTTNMYLPTCTIRKLPLWPTTYNKCNEKLMEHVTLWFGWKLGTWCIHSYFRSVTITYEYRTWRLWQDITVTMSRIFKIRTVPLRLGVLLNKVERLVTRKLENVNQGFPNSRDKWAT